MKFTHKILLAIFGNPILLLAAISEISHGFGHWQQAILNPVTNKHFLHIKIIISQWHYATLNSVYNVLCVYCVQVISPC